MSNADACKRTTLITPQKNWLYKHEIVLKEVNHPDVYCLDHVKRTAFNNNHKTSLHEMLTNLSFSNILDINSFAAVLWLKCCWYIIFNTNKYIYYSSLPKVHLIPFVINAPIRRNKLSRYIAFTCTIKRRSRHIRHLRGAHHLICSLYPPTLTKTEILTTS